MKNHRFTFGSLFLALIVVEARGQQIPGVEAHQPPPDGTWTADARIEGMSRFTDTKLGAGQGIAIYEGKVYAYGDVRSVNPRVGVIREYDLELRPTGREVWLRKENRPLILHPTGLTWDNQFGTFLGDTVNKKARIYQIDWKKAWADGNLDHAVLAEIDDDASVNGCRPEFVTVEGRRFLATADYGEIRPEIRLLDPKKLVQAGRTSAPGVIAHRILAGSWNQSLHWNQDSGQLTCVENVIEGRGWRLDVIDLARAIRDGRVDGPGVRVDRSTFDPHDELEGFCRMSGTRCLFITSSRSGNIVSGVIERTEPHPTSPPSDPEVR